ncbi:Frataxin [Rickenella mellea]|uniref:ferroxidase n=1 Tax=Rickenella mellea TaxID=50990 RepID=A0A4Y7QMH2_9AGAM|nr:Frataxin [Rickenella mellea]
MTTPPPMLQVSDIPMERYHALSDATMDTLLESLETVLDMLGSSRYEVEYSSGVLTLNLAEHGTYVINKQPPNKQIWLSSPFSGPKRYDYISTADGWFYSRDGRSMGNLLEEELSKTLAKKVHLGVDQISKLIS